MHNRKTCCLEQSDGHNFTLLFSQSNAKKKKKIQLITGKSDLPKYRTTGQNIGWSQTSHKHRACAVIICKPANVATEINKSTSTKRFERCFSCKESVRDVQSWPISMHSPSSICCRCCNLQCDHLNTVDCRFLGISLIVCWTMAPNSTNSIPYVWKSHANLPKHDTKWEKLLRCPVKVVLKRSRSRSTFHFSKSPCSFSQ